jgi:adenosine kinase
MANENHLIVMCNPLLDISAVVDEDFLKKYDLQPNGAILAEEKHLPLYDELVQNYNVSYIAGGSGQNTARGTKYMIPHHPAYYFGSVGVDSYAHIMKQESEKEGVKVLYHVDEITPTGTCAVLITGQNRSLVANLSAANKYQMQHLKDNWHLFEQGNIFYITGFFLTVCQDGILQVARHASSNMKTLIMNLSAPFVSQFYKSSITELIPHLDIIVGNETEALAFAQNNAIDFTEIKDIAKATQALPKVNSKPRIVVFTQGPMPTIVCMDGKITEYPVIPIKPEEIIDTNGAGDAFVGGFLSQLVQGKEMSKCVAAGHYLANIIIRQSGCCYPADKCSFE